MSAIVTTEPLTDTAERATPIEAPIDVPITEGPGRWALRWTLGIVTFALGLAFTFVVLSMLGTEVFLPSRVFHGY